MFLINAVRYALLPVTFPLMLGVAVQNLADYTAENNHSKKAKLAAKLLKPSQQLGRFILPSEVYLSVGD